MHVEFLRPLTSLQISIPDPGDDQTQRPEISYKKFNTHVQKHTSIILVEKELGESVQPTARYGGNVSSGKIRKWIY